MVLSSLKTVMGRHEAALIFLLGVLLLLPRIWCETSITGQDEYWLSFRTPMETLERGEWFTPWVNGEPRLKKPPLLYWAILLTYKLFGINLFAARIWGVLSGAGLAMSSCLLYRILFKKSGILAGLITLATISVAIDGRRAMLDLPLAFLTSMAIYFAIRWGTSGRQGWVLVSAISLGLSFLVKGPVGIVVFAVGALGALIVLEKWSFVLLRWSQIALASALLLAICLPWPLIMAYLWPNFFEIVDGEIAARHLGTVHFRSPFSILGGALGLIFPWSLIMIAALVHSLCHARERIVRKELWLTVWFLGCVAPFFFMEAFARYMTPVVPAACVLCASWLERHQGKWKGAFLGISVSLMAVISIPFCLFLIWFGHGVLIGVLCLIFVGLMLWVTFAMGDVRLVALSVALLLALIMGGLYPSLGINAMPAGLDKIVGSSPVASYNGSQPSMLSIRLKRSAVRIRSFDKNDRRRLKDFQGFVFMGERAAKGFETLCRELGIHFQKAGQFKSFYSREAWIRFVREDATRDDWERALKTHSLEGLKPTIHYYRVTQKRNLLSTK
ncbi:MAG: glycosyltransferase family 39 protein [Desulfobacteraceae bacterium]|nr:glycosyltransferase family 39 protein [Desulfobacteraceae bacterium]